MREISDKRGCVKRRDEMCNVCDCLYICMGEAPVYILYRPSAILATQSANREAFRITQERANYAVITNNCQNFAAWLLEVIAPGADCPETI